MTKGLNPDTKTGRINIKALEIVQNSPDGIRWTDLNKQIEEWDPQLHPKTINGCTWQLTNNFPDKVTKTDGLFEWRG